VPRRVSLPGADELFRPTRVEAAPRAATGSEPDHGNDPTGQPDRVPGGDLDGRQAGRPGARRTTPSGRVRHDEKITIYVTADELLTLEHTRLALRAKHGVAVDRGRIVREAIHLALQDVADRGDESALVGRLREQ
jgi:hypothetical protein